MRLTVGHYLTDRRQSKAVLRDQSWDENTGTPAFPSANGHGPSPPIGGPAEGRLARGFTNSNQQFASYQSSFDSAEMNSANG